MGRGRSPNGRLTVDVRLADRTDLSATAFCFFKTSNAKPVVISLSSSFRSACCAYHQRLRVGVGAVLLVEREGLAEGAVTVTLGLEVGRTFSVSSLRLLEFSERLLGVVDALLESSSQIKLERLVALWLVLTALLLLLELVVVDVEVTDDARGLEVPTRNCLFNLARAVLPTRIPKSASNLRRRSDKSRSSAA